jgi:hypothetical protein
MVILDMGRLTSHGNCKKKAAKSRVDEIFLAIQILSICSPTVSGSASVLSSGVLEVFLILVQTCQPRQSTGMVPVPPFNTTNGFLKLA